jgi:phage-related protein
MLDLGELTVHINADTTGLDTGMNKAKSSINGFEEAERKAGDTSDEASDKIRQTGDAVDDAGNKANKSKSGWTVLKGALSNVLAQGFMMLADGAKKAVATVIHESAEMEQQVGGVKKLFGSNYTTVINNAQKAYKTAGISANQYMEQITSFSASLLQSVGGDTEKAAKVGDMAIQDMADNANTFGTSIGDIQNAYQGFAKQNYTMLDNLKLGYGGTKTEMERLLADAGKLTGKKYDISNLKDVYEAIHVIQKEQKITGTTAEEASKTFSGSMDSMRSAWLTFAGELGTGNTKDIQTGLSNALSATKTFVINGLGGLVKTIATSLGSLLMSALPAPLQKALSSLGGPLKSYFSTLVGWFKDIFSGIGSFFSNMFGTIFKSSALSEYIGLISKGLTNAMKVIAPIASAIGETIKKVLSVAGKIVGSAVVVQIKAIVIAIKAIIAVVKAVIAVIKTLWNAGKTAVNGLKTAFSKVGSIISAPFKKGWSIIKHIFNVIKSGAKTAVSGVKSAFSKVFSILSTPYKKAWNIIKGVFNKIKNGAKNAVEGVKSGFSKVTNFISNPFKKAKNAVSNIINSIRNKAKNIFSGIKPKLNLSLPHVSVSGGKAPYGIGGKGKLPSFHVSWYAKGGYFDSPTILSGLGEAGPEYALPLNKTSLTPLANMLNELQYKNGNPTTSDNEPIIVNTTIELDGKVVARQTAPYMKKEINKLDTRSNRRLGTV